MAPIAGNQDLAITRITHPLDSRTGFLPVNKFSPKDQVKNFSSKTNVVNKKKSLSLLTQMPKLNLVQNLDDWEPE